MEKILKQDEIDALFQAARNRTKDEETKSRSKVHAYNFAQAGQISNEQMRAISMLNDLFARNLTHTLGAWLRTKFHVNLVSAEQMSFNEFMLRIPEVSYVGSVRLEPLGAVSVMQLDLALAPLIVDLLLGGEGYSGPIRELTDIEESILSSVVEIICRELSVAWQPVGLSFHFERRQMHTQIARFMPLTEKTLCLSFEIRMPEASGLLNLAFPAVVSNTVLRSLVGDWSRRRQAGPARERMQQRVRKLVFDSSVQLPPVSMTVRELEGISPGQILRLNIPANQKAQFLASGVPLFHAGLVRSGEHRAAHLADECSLQD